ncbi:anti-sigma factor RsiW [Nakamurella sp. UYEF19]|uniref:anti-sigma factor n=1 Tax=Nakamurella sp. UYEF19 TaxID=1756392 RepID=UPI00339686D5
MNTDQHLNSGAMALGSLPDDEAVEFTDHLDSCPTCAAELTSFLETAATLGSSVAQTPPASLRRSVMEAVARTPQLPPLTDSTLGRHRQPNVATGTGPVWPVQEDAPDGPLAEVIPMRRPWYRRPQALLAAAVAVLVIGGGTTLVVANQSPSTPSVAACLASATDKATLVPNVGSGGTVTLTPSCDAAVVNMPNLPALPAGSVYQLWVLHGSDAKNATSAGVVDRKADGSVTAVTADVRAGSTAVGVSVEPASPVSVTPTTTPIWVVPLST